MGLIFFALFIVFLILWNKEKKKRRTAESASDAMTNQLHRATFHRDQLQKDLSEAEKGNLKLIVHIYTSLHGSLARDFNFLHQKSKCYLNYAYILSRNDEKLEYLEEARELC